MKNLKRLTVTAIVAFALALITTVSAQAQMKVVESAPVEEIGKHRVLGSTFAEITKQGDTYTFMYKDNKFTHITDFKSFTMNEESFEGLYKTIMDNWKNPPKEDMMLEFEDGYVWLKFTRLFGIGNVEIAHTETGDVIGFSVPLTKKQTQKLFGKR